MRKNFASTVILCCTLLLLQTSCCNEDVSVRQGAQYQKVHLSLLVDDVFDVSNANHDVNNTKNATTRSVFYPSTGVTKFTEGDVVHVACNGKYIGKLTCSGGVFQGDIVKPDATDYLYVYFLGNKNGSELEIGDTECLLNIRNQTDELPLIYYGKSLTKYTGPEQTYICILTCQCAVVEVSLYPGTDQDVTLSGVKTSAFLDFSNLDNPVTTRQSTGSITFHSKSPTKKYAVLLPQDSVPQALLNINGQDTIINLHKIEANHAYLDEEAIFIQEDTSPITYIVDCGTENRPDGSIGNLFDNNPSTEWAVNSDCQENGIWYAEFHTNRPITPNSYAIWGANLYDSYTAKSWRLLARYRDVDDWTVISTVTDSWFLQNSPFVFALDVNGQTWQYFRLEVLENRNKKYSMAIPEFRLYHEKDPGPGPDPIPEPEPEPEPKPLTPESFVATSGSGGISENHGYDKCIDGDFGTYWESKIWMRENGVWFVEFYRVTPFVPTGYTLYAQYYGTPKSWKLLAKKKLEDEWTAISTKRMDKLYLFYDPLDVSLDVQGETWQYFRFEVSELTEEDDYFNNYLIIRELSLHW